MLGFQSGATRTQASAAAMIAVCIAATSAMAEQSATPGPQPAEIVDELDASLTDVMKNADELGYSGRFDRLAPTVRRLFDLDFMTQKIAGRHWKAMTPEEQVRLVDTFGRYTIANYAGRFSGWSGREFRRLGEEPAPRGTVVVRTELLDPDGENVKLDYRLRHTPERGWQIVDIYFNGTVSELALRRSEYSSLIQREGLPALLSALDERIAKLAAGTSNGD